MSRSNPAAIALTCLVAFGAVANRQTPAPASQTSEEAPCESRFSSISLGDAVAMFDSERLLHPLLKARTLFHLHRKQEALAKLDWATRELARNWGGRIPADRRAEIARQVTTFRDCVATSEPPGLVPVTVRTFELDGTKAGGRGNALGGAYVYIDDYVRVGRTDSTGALRIQAPPGPIRLTAVMPPSSAGEGDTISTPPKGGVVSIVLDDSKEPAEDTEADIVEAVEDVLRPTSGSFTLRFMEEGTTVQVTSVEEVVLQDRDGNEIMLRDPLGREIDSLTDTFTVLGGDVVAKAPARLLAALPRGQWVVLVVTAIDGAGLRHWDRIPIRIQAQPHWDTVCDTERDIAMSSIPDTGVPDERSVRNNIQQAVALSRFHRTSAALTAIDRAGTTVAGLPSVFEAGERSQMTATFSALRACIAGSTAPVMATLSIRVRTEGHEARAGAYVRVDDIPVGRTSSDGSLKTQVPSGPVRITAVEPSRLIGSEMVSLPAGAIGDASVVLLPGRDVVEDTELLVAEARDGRLPATSATLTLQFVRDGQRVPQVRLEQVEALSSSGRDWREMRDLFRIVDGAIQAADLRRVEEALPHDERGRIRLRVRAIDAAGFTHLNFVEFRIE